MKLNQDTIAAAKKRLLRMHYESGIGHIGGNLSCIDAMLLVHHEYLKGGTFILSKGHAAGALYVTLWSTGEISNESLSTFHDNGTKLPAHPPSAGVAGIPFATGSLGHGLSLAAGTALAKRIKGDPGHVFCLTSDGEWQEGSTWEALIFATHNRLKNLTIMIDLNGLQGFGSTEVVASMHDLPEKIRAFDVEMFTVPGYDLDAIRGVLEIETNRPKCIILLTNKGNGVSFMQDKMEWHYLPINEEMYKKAIEEISP